MQRRSRSDRADWYLDGDVLAGPDGPFAVTGELWRALPHDIENTLAVAASLAPLGVPPEAVARAASTLRRWRTGHPGRRTRRTDLLRRLQGHDPARNAVGARGFDRVVLIAGGATRASI